MVSYYLCIVFPSAFSWGTKRSLHQRIPAAPDPNHHG